MKVFSEYFLGFHFFAGTVKKYPNKTVDDEESQLLIVPGGGQFLPELGDLIPN